MKKKEYMMPQTQVITVALRQIIAISGGSKNDNVNINSGYDNDTEINRSRRHKNVWDDEEEDF